ncbi:MAG: hypothetical protein EOP60_00940 [Sphingomonadales bacterium]|nr:MAG: hypothetical protein EOP60_00940 [Sphingomonadales bacterium]
MIDEDERPSHEGTAMLYDYFKHLTSLCLFSLGGVLALADKVQGRSTMLLIGALSVIGASALISFTAAGEIVDARYKGKPLAKHLNFYRMASPVLLSLGLGMFLYIFVGTMKP